MVKAVIFDMDGLMFDTERLSNLAWAETGQKTGHPEITEEFMNQFIGSNLRATRETFLRTFGEDFPFDELRAMRVKFVEDYVAEHGLPVKPGLYELIDFIKKQRLPMALATSTAEAKTRENLKMAGIEDVFDVMVCGDQVARSKPEPDIFLRAAELLGAAPEACLVLEDSLNGITAAYRAGMMPVMVPDLIPPTTEIEAMLFHKCNTLSDVIPLLERELSK